MPWCARPRRWRAAETRRSAVTLAASACLRRNDARHPIEPRSEDAEDQAAAGAVRQDAGRDRQALRAARRPAGELLEQPAGLGVPFRRAGAVRRAGPPRTARHHPSLHQVRWRQRPGVAAPRQPAAPALPPARRAGAAGMRLGGDHDRARRRPHPDGPDGLPHRGGHLAEPCALAGGPRQRACQRQPRRADARDPPVARPAGRQRREPLSFAVPVRAPAGDRRGGWRTTSPTRQRPNASPPR